eukprot:COSAG06_NODE_8202_length_2239_cov_3.221963_1_plen_39_part_10
MMQVEREYYPERFGFELFGDPFEKKRYSSPHPSPRSFEC